MKLKLKVCALLALLLALLCTAALAATSSDLKYRQTYDANGLVTERVYENDEGETTVAEDLGYAIVRMTYRNRKVTKTEYLDAEGQPAIHLTFHLSDDRPVGVTVGSRIFRRMA